MTKGKNKAPSLFKPDEKITIGFLQGTETQKDEFLEVWSSVIKNPFEILDDPEKATIRVGYKVGESWAYIGKDALNVSTGPTVNIGWSGKDLLNNLISKIFGCLNSSKQNGK